jgi:hypothetical protein
VTRSALVGLALVVGLLATGCGDEPTCDDLESITEELGDMDTDDPDYNKLASDARLAAADCNS